MPYTYKKVGDKYCVYKKDTGKKVGCTDGNKKALYKYLKALRSNVNELFDTTNLKNANEIPVLKGDLDPDKLVRMKLAHTSDGVKDPVRKLIITFYREIYWVKYLKKYKDNNSDSVFLLNNENDENGFYSFSIEIKPNEQKDSFKIEIIDFVESNDGSFSEGYKSELIHSDINVIVSEIQKIGFDHFKRWSKNVVKVRNQETKNWNIDGMKVKADLNSMKYLKKFNEL